jgi:hypothetical protein
MFKHNDNYYILLNKDGQTIRGFDTVEKALDYWERGYVNSIGTGYTGMMSACIHYTQIQPSIIVVDDLDEIQQNLVELPTSAMKFDCSLYGMPATGPRAKAYWENGKKPNLLKYRSM